MAEKTGQTLTLDAILIPGATPSPVDAYVVRLLPDGATIFSVTLAGTLVPGLVPIAPNFLPFPVSARLVTYTFTGTEPPGAHRLLGGLTVPGTLTLVGPLADLTFTFGP